MKALRIMVLSLSLTACSGGVFETKNSPPIVYVLAPAKPNESIAPLTIDLTVALPAAAPGLDTERIASLRDGRRLEYYKDAQWGATAAQVMQSLLVATLQNQRLFRSVTAEQARISATHLLDLQLQDFQAEYVGEQAAPTVRVSLTASLVRLKDRKLLASLPVNVTVAADANRMSAVIAAFEAAAQQAALRIGEQTGAVLRESTRD